MRVLLLAPIVLALSLFTTHVQGLEKNHQEVAAITVNKPSEAHSKAVAHVKKKKPAKKVVVKKAPQKPPEAPKPAITGVERWRKLVAFYFPASQVEKALTVIKGESGGNPNALSPTADRGLFQINEVHAGKVGGDLNKLFDPETNVQVALQIWEDQGWCPWTVGRNLGYCS